MKNGDIGQGDYLVDAKHKKGKSNSETKKEEKE